MDDLIVGVSFYGEAHKLFDNSRMILGEAGTKLQKWSTNSKELTGHMNKTADEMCTSTESQLAKVLGILLKTEKDSLHTNLQPLFDFVEQMKDTKRFVFQTTSRLFDPLGLLSPYSIRAKILF